MVGWNKWQAAAFKVPAFGSDSFHTSPTLCTDIVDPLVLSRNPCSTTRVQPTFKMNLRSRKVKKTPPPVHLRKPTTKVSCAMKNNDPYPMEVLTVEQRLANDEAQAEAILCGSPDNGEGLVGNASSFARNMAGRITFGENAVNRSSVLSSGGKISSDADTAVLSTCLLYTSPSPRDRTRSRMPSSA